MESARAVDTGCHSVDDSGRQWTTVGEFGVPISGCLVPN